jgi:hypothetical protein
LWDPDGPRHWYSVVTSHADGVALYFDNELLAVCDDAGAAVEWLLWEINRAVAASSNEHLLFHAGGIELDGMALLFPAPSGSGKSTLVAALVQRGAGYLSDELVGLTADGSLALPYAKPISLKPGSFDVLADLRPDLIDELVTEEWYVRPDSVRRDATGQPCVPSIFIVPRFVADGGSRLTQLSSTELFLALTMNSVNLDHHGEAGTRLLGDLAQGCPGFELEIADLSEACQLVHQVAESRTASSGG